MIKPLLDYIFTKKEEQEVIYKNFAAFWNAIMDKLNVFFADFNLFQAFGADNYFEEIRSQIGMIFQHSDTFMLLKVICVVVVILIIFKNISYMVRKVSFTNATGKIVRDLRNKLFNKYLEQSLSFFSKNYTGDALVRIEKDCRIVMRSLLRKLFQTVQKIVTALVLIYIAIQLNAKLLLISILVAPPLSLALAYIGKKVKKYAERIQTKSADLFSFVEERISSIDVVKYFANEDYEQDEFKKINEKYFRFWRKSRIYDALKTPISELNGVVIGLIIVLVGGYQVINHPEIISFGDYMAFLMVTFSILSPVKKIAKNYPAIKKGLVSLDRILYIIEQPVDLEESDNPVSKDNFNDRIKFKNVSFSYKKGGEVLKNINLEIERGEQVAFVGSSGSGKTTLLRLLPRMYGLDEGDITIDGISIKDIKLDDLRSLFGVVPQAPKLFSATVKHNIGYSNPENTDIEKVKEAAEIAYADEFIDDLNETYGYQVENKGANFSGGQKQRISIARALAGEPSILIFDEATSSLDTKSEQKVQMAIEEATKNHTVLVIAHRLSTILNSDRIVVLDEGEIIDIGPHEELLETCETYKELYDLQFNNNA